MIKDILEDLILIGLVILAAWLAWKYWLSGLLGSSVEAVKRTAAEYKADVGTIASAARSPWEVVNDLFTAKTPYISQDQFRQNIAEIQRNLKGQK